MSSNTNLPPIMTKSQEKRIEAIFSRLEQMRGRGGGGGAGGGVISAKQLGWVLRSVGVALTEAELHDLIAEGGGRIDASEFKHILCKKLNDCNEEREIGEAFRFFDKDNDRSIGAADLSAALKEMGAKMKDDQIRELLREIDLDDDGRVTLEEFSKVLL